MLITIRKQRQTDDNIFINMLIVTLGDTPEMVLHHSHMLDMPDKATLRGRRKKNKKHTLYSLLRPREKSNEKANICTNVLI